MEANDPNNNQRSSQASNNSDLDASQLDQFEVSTKAEATKKATKWGIKKFEDWCSKRNISIDYCSILAGALAEFLRKYYAKVKTKDKTMLAPSGILIFFVSFYAK